MRGRHHRRHGMRRGAERRGRAGAIGFRCETEPRVAAWPKGPEENWTLRGSGTGGEAGATDATVSDSATDAAHDSSTDAPADANTTPPGTCEESQPPRCAQFTVDEAAACVLAPADEGLSCGNGGTCHNGVCAVTGAVCARAYGERRELLGDICILPTVDESGACSAVPNTANDGVACAGPGTQVPERRLHELHRASRLRERRRACSTTDIDHDDKAWLVKPTTIARASTAAPATSTACATERTTRVPANAR